MCITSGLTAAFLVACGDLIGDSPVIGFGLGILFPRHWIYTQTVTLGYLTPIDGSRAFIIKEGSTGDHCQFSFFYRNKEETNFGETEKGASIEFFSFDKGEYHPFSQQGNIPKILPALSVPIAFKRAGRAFGWAEIWKYKRPGILPALTVDLPPKSDKVHYRFLLPAWAYQQELDLTFAELTFADVK